jgi:apolipoprotein N-acyltransferase
LIIGLVTPPFSLFFCGWIAYSVIAFLLLKIPKNNLLIPMAIFGVHILFIRVISIQWVLPGFEILFKTPINAVLALILFYGILVCINMLYGLVYGKILKLLPANINIQAIFLWLFLVFWDSTVPRIFPDSIIKGSINSKILCSATYYLQPLGLRLLLFGFSTFSALIFVKYYSVNRVKYFYTTILFTCIIWGGYYLVGLKAFTHLTNEYSQLQPIVLFQDNQGAFKRNFNKKKGHPTNQSISKMEQKELREYFSELSKLHLSLKLKASKDFQKLQTNFKEKIPENWAFWSECTICRKYDPKSNEKKVFSNLNNEVDLQALGYQHIELQGIEMQKGGYSSFAYFHKNSGYLNSYYKNFPFPLREYIPLEERFPILRTLYPMGGKLKASKKQAIIPHPTPSGPVFVTFICYESTKTEFVSNIIAEAKRRYPKRDLILVNPSSDDIFGISLENHQHSMLGRFLAAKHGLPLLRVNTFGFTEIIAPWGESIYRATRDESITLPGLLPVKKTTFRNIN